jgi:hypothetical protein
MPDEKYFEEFVDQYIARATYINNHPERENPLYRSTLFKRRETYSLRKKSSQNKRRRRYDANH